MQELGLNIVVERIQEAIRDENYDLANELLWPALDQKPDVGPLWFYAGILTSLGGKHAPAYEFFRRSQELDPHPANWANLGGVLRSMGRVDECRHLLLKGLERTGEDDDVLANLCGSYVNEGEPSKGIEFGERALKVNPDHLGCKFNLGLLHLESGNYARGFDLYAEGAHRHRTEKVYDPDPPALTPELHEQMKGQGKRLIVWAEQGIGDELMFSTILRDAKKDYEIVFECHARLETLFQHAAWMKSPGHAIELHPTRKIHGDESVSGSGADAKIALGNLGQLYRRDLRAFLQPNQRMLFVPRGTNTTTKIVQQVRDSSFPQTRESLPKLLPQMPCGLQTDVWEAIQGSQCGAEGEGDQSRESEYGGPSGASSETTVPGMREPRGPETSRGLQSAANGEVAMSALSPLDASGSWLNVYEPVYSADPREARQMRAHLEKIAAGRKIIGLALRGGTMSTARTYRMLPPQVLGDLLNDPRYLFVSLDYEDMTTLGDYIAKAHGPGRFLWYPSVVWAWDYKHTAALVKATDAVVTVCQSVAHLSAAMGHPTYVLTPSKPAWRYGVTGESWYWYPHKNACLLRQHGGDWGPPASQLTEALQARFGFGKEQAA